jgi:hypothetical protein
MIVTTMSNEIYGIFDTLKEAQHRAKDLRYKPQIFEIKEIK